MSRTTELPVGMAYGKEPRETRGGWFAGAFLPEGNIGRSEELGLAVKLLTPGMVDKPHTHTQKVEVCANIGRHDWGPIRVDGEEIMVRPGEAVISYPGAIMEWEIPEESKKLLVLVVEAPSVSDKELIKEDEYEARIQEAKRNSHHRVINLREESVTEKGLEMEYLELKPGQEESEAYNVDGKEAILALKRHLPVRVNGESLILNAGKYLFLEKGVRLELDRIPDGSRPVEAVRIRVPAVGASE